mmetsp:Transcript_8276/g.30573  ORF Transcript_8276/g.30573 Transcript_8276/m.30573 type:complete len:100 (-) Transcript_8276:144-443(-)
MHVDFLAGLHLSCSLWEEFCCVGYHYQLLSYTTFTQEIQMRIMNSPDIHTDRPVAQCVSEGSEIVPWNLFTCRVAQLYRLGKAITITPQPYTPRLVDKF